MDKMRSALLSDGYSAPHRLFSEAEASEYYNQFFRDAGVSATGTEQISVPTYGWHHTRSWVWELATNHKLLLMAQSALGCEDVVLFGSSFWYKPVHDDRRVPWHQDGASWKMNPCTAVTAWISLGHATPENGGVRLLPGSHDKRLNHVKKEGLAYYFFEEIPEEEVDISKVVSPSLLPGEVLWFNEHVIHGSEPNSSTIPRLGFTARFCPSSVQFLTDKCDLVSSPIKTYLVSGRDFGADANQSNRHVSSF